MSNAIKAIVDNVVDSQGVGYLRTSAYSSVQNAVVTEIDDRVSLAVAAAAERGYENEARQILINAGLLDAPALESPAPVEDEEDEQFNSVLDTLKGALESLADYMSGRRARRNN